MKTITKVTMVTMPVAVLTTSWYVSLPRWPLTKTAPASQMTIKATAVTMAGNDPNQLVRFEMARVMGCCAGHRPWSEQTPLPSSREWECGGQIPAVEAVSALRHVTAHAASP